MGSRPRPPGWPRRPSRALTPAVFHLEVDRSRPDLRLTSRPRNPYTGIRGLSHLHDIECRHRERKRGDREMSLALASVDTSVDVGMEVPCRRFDPDLWFADAPAELELAKSLCGDCRVRVECLAGAVERQEPWGVWGGEIFERGAVGPRKRPRGRPRKEDVARDEVLRVEVADRVAAQLVVAA